MNFIIIAPGRLKEKYLKDACAEYEKRLSAFGRVTNAVYEPVRLPESPSQKEIEAALAAEAELIEKLWNGYKIALCIEGGQISSEKLSDKIRKCSVEGFSTFSFIIGSSYGLAESLKKKADMRLSMSEMTFPHQLARVMLLEQIYRANMILSGRKYHK
jgi:23S rRNA (pseudouridine1915-N3)-methyltransferase